MIASMKPQRGPAVKVPASFSLRAVPLPLVRTFHHDDFRIDDLIEAKRGRRVSVALPARNEAPTIGPIVSTIRKHLARRRRLVDEIVVVDDRSTDGTPARAASAGATVVSADEILPECDPGGGKGDAMWKSLHVTDGDFVVWCDADVRNFSPAFVIGLLGPLLTTDDVGLVKGFYDRPLDGVRGEGGRVTELVARPLISMYFPHLAGVRQPLAGEYAGRREVLERVPFVQGYGVDLGILIDVVEQFGLGALAQVDLGVRVHRNRPLDELGPQALAVLHAALARAGVSLPVPVPPLLQPGGRTTPVEVDVRPPMIEVPAYRQPA
jgi:glucosyl-3-phosphoglycerate synthase